MTYVVKPKFHHPELPKNKLGYHPSRLRGHDLDAVRRLRTRFDHRRAIIEACFELSIEPHRVAKISGIGCSSKTPDLFPRQFARL